MSNIVEISEEQFQFKIKGTIISIDQATVDQELDHQEKLKKIQDKEDYDMKELYETNLKYLISLGADEKIIRSVSRAGFLKILSTINGEEQKK